MSADEYVPSEGQIRAACYDVFRPAEFDRFLARVRRDAAREALDGLAGHSERLAEAGLLGAGTAKIQRAAAVIATEYRDTHYPEENPRD